MKRKSIFLRLLLLAALCVPWVTQAQSTLTVADGTTTNSYVPVYGYYCDAYLRAQFVYPEADLSDMGTATISQMDFYLSSSASAAWTGTFRVYLAEASSTSISAFEDASNMTLVYDGQLDATGATMSIVFDDEYSYDGGNLLVSVEQYETGNYKSASFYGLSSTGSSVQGYNYNSLSGVSPTQRNFLPKVTFTYEAATASSCTKPGAITVSNITATSADLSWTAGDSETSWKVYLNDTYVATVSSTEYTLTGLSSLTAYTASVTSDCGSEESSPRNASFNTPCGGTTCQFTFSGNDSYGDGWNGNTINVLQNGINVGSFTLASGSSYTSTVSVCQGVPVVLSWQAGSYANETSFTVADGTDEVVYTCTNGSSLSAGTFYTIADACPVITCPKPTELEATNVTKTGATFTWTAGGEESLWEVTLYDGANELVSTDYPTTATIAYSDLAINTPYTVKVRAICGADDSSKYATVAFRTMADTVTSFPYECDFENGAGSAEWVLLNGTQPNYWMMGDDANSTTSLYITDDGESYSYDYYSSSVTYAYATFYLEPGMYEYTYDWLCNGYGSGTPPAIYGYDYLRVLMVPATTTLTPGSSLGYYSIPTGAYSMDGGNRAALYGQSSWQTRTGAFEVTEAGTYKMVLMWANGTYYAYNGMPAAVDNIVINQTTCYLPTWASTQAEPTTTSMTLAWTENTPEAATTWDIAYGTPGFDPKNALEAKYRMGVTDNPYTLTGLKHSTPYGVRVRAVCDADNGEYSAWSEELTFQTPCAPWAMAELPLVEEFDDNLLPCWQHVGGSASISSGRINIWSTNSMIILPEMGVNLNMLDVVLDAAQYSSDSNPYPIEVGYLTDVEDTTTFVPVETINLTTDSYNTFTIPFGEVVTDASYIAIRGRIYSGSSWSDFNLARVEVRLHADVDTLANAGETKALCNTFVIPEVDENLNYSNNVNATYTLTPATEGLALRLEGTYDLEAGDTLTVYRGIGAGKVLYKKVSGTGSLLVDSTCNDWAVNNGVTLVLTTNASNTDNHEGFRLLATCVCPVMALDSALVETHSSYTFIMEGDEPGTTTSTVIANHATTQAAADVVRQGNQALNTVWHSTVQPQCDSLYQKRALVLHPDYNLSLEDNICEGTTYNLMGTTKTTGGIYTEAGKSIYGADSVVTMNLQLRAKPTAAIQYEGRNTTAINNLCEGTTISLLARSGNQNAVFEWEDASTEATRTVTPMANATYSMVAMDTIYGCYSDTAQVVVTIVPVAAPYITATDSTVCAGLPTTLTVNDASGLELSYKWSTGDTTAAITVNPTATTTYTVTATTGTGCATSAELTINVNALPTAVIATSATEICLNDDVILTADLAEGYSYAWNATAGTGLATNAATLTPAAAGNYSATVTITDANGCVSEITSPVVTVHPSYEMNYEASACIANLPYTFGTQSLSVDGTYDETFTIAYGCDSLVHLAFTVQDTAVNNYYRELCQGTEFTFGDSIYAQTYTATESTVISYINELGECPVREVLNLTVYMPAATAFEATACDSYTWNEETYTTTGNYEQTLKTSHNCDSVVTLALTVNYSNTGIDEQQPCDSLTWIDGITYKELTSENDAPTFTVTNAAGCDSVVTLNITAIRHATVGYDEITWCDTRTYTWIDGEVYTMSELDSNITFTLPTTLNAAGCDTTSVLLLTFNLANDTLNWADTTVCDEFLVNTLLCDGTTEQVSIRDSGDYQLRVLDPVSGNPVIARYHVYVNESAHWTTVKTECVPYTWEVMDKTNSFVVATVEDIYPTTGVSDTLISYQMPVMDGCADIQTLYLHVNYPEQGVEEATVCYGEPYYLKNYSTIYFNSASVPGPGTYESDLTSGIASFHTVGNDANGCQIDSILMITVLPVYNVTSDLELCESEFTLNAETGLYTYTVTDANHAGQSVDLTYSGELDETEYVGSVVASWQTNDGCDSTVMINYTVYPNESFDTVDVCGTYQGPDGVNYQESKTFSNVTGRTPNGCDITRYTYFNMHERSLTDQYIVSTDPYTWVDGVTYEGDTAGVMFNYVVGGICDSTLILHFDRVDSLLLCAASLPYVTDYGFTIAAGEVSNTYSNAATNGNDTIISYTIDPGTFNVEDSTVCDSYTWHGTEYTESGSYTYSYTNENGCPSVDTLILTVNNSYATAITPTACDSYFWVDSTYEASTVVTKTFEAANECDSVVTMTLTINKHVTDVQTVAACESYEWNEVTYTESGAYAATVTDDNTCVGVDSLYLTINHAVVQDSDLIVNAASYTYTDGILRLAPFDTIYTYFFEGADVNGCDSTLNIHLWLQQGNLIGDTIFSCGNYTWINGHIYSYLSMEERMAHGMAFYYDLTDQAYVTVYPEHNIFNADGSLRETHVLLLTMAEAQYGDSVTVNFPLSQETLTYTGTSEGTTSFDFTAIKSLKKDTTVYRDVHYPAISYCDSIVPLKINLVYNYDTTEATVCGTEATYAFNGHTFDLGAAGTTTLITDTLNKGEATEWVSSVNVTRKEIADSTFALTVCDALTYNGHTYTTSGLYVDTLAGAAADGCDSITYITLTVKYNTSSPDVLTICDSTVWHGVTYTESGDYTYSYTATNGCPSVDTLHLTINKHITDTTVVVCDTYTWYASGETYTESGDTVATYVDQNGCSGATTLHLTVNKSQVKTDTIVSTDGSYRLYGVLYLAEYEGDIDSMHTSTVTGCDSLYRVHLVVTHYQYEYENQSACGVYTWARNNKTYGWISSTESAANGNALYKNIPDGTYVTSNPTDTIGMTIYMLNLTLSEAALTEADTTFPLSQVTLALGGETFDYSTQLAAKANADVTEIVHFGSTYYCDSIVTYTVHLVYNYDTLDDEVVCFEENTLEWNGNTHNLAVGNNEITEVLNAGTVNEMVTTRHIMRRDTVGSEFPQVACDSYEWEGQTYTTTQNVLHTYTDANGCDSVVTMLLTINNNSNHGETPDAQCDTYTWHGTTYTASGDYTYAYEAGNGCPSVDTLHLTIKYNEGLVIRDTACDSYTWTHRDDSEESWASLSGDSFTSYFAFTGTNGCPAQDTLLLTVRHATSKDSILYVSSGSYIYNDTMIVAGQTKQYYYHYTNAQGCDSLFHLTINVGTANYVLEDTTVCDHYAWIDGNTYYYSDAAMAAGALYADQDGNYITSNPVFIDSVNNPSYDTIHILSLHLTQRTTSSDEVDFRISHNTLSYGDSIFDFSAQNTTDFVNATITKEVHFASQHYCDSVVMLTINMINNHVVLPDRDICVTQDTVIVHGQTVSTATTDYDHVQLYTDVTVYDATEDVVYHQSFTQHPLAYATERRDACDTYTWNGTTFNYDDYALQAVNDTVTISGATAMLKTAYGCDSVVTLVLTLKHNTDFTVPVIACDSYNWTTVSDATEKGALTQSGEYTHDFVNQFGCPSVETLNLTIDHSYADVVVEETACDSFTWLLNGETYTESIDTPSVTLYTTVGGCDSVVVLHLTINNNSNSATTQVICANEEVQWNGTSYNTTGVYTYEYDNPANGCPSVDTLHLTVNPTYNVALVDQTVCDSYDWFGETVTESGDLTKTFESVDGCDSIFTMTLTVNHSVIMPTETVVECQSYTWAQNGQTYTTTGIYYDTLTHPVTGCDSIHVLDLTIGTGRGFAVETITNCGPFTWVVNGEEIDTFTESIETSTNFTSPLSGCDSVVYLRLTVNPLRDTVATLCETELPFSWRGHEYTTTGVFTDTEEYTTNDICDSAVRLTVTVNPTLTTNLTDQICLGLGYDRYGFTISADSLTVSGTYTYTETLTSNQYGCDSIVTLTLNVGDLLTETIDVTACDSYVWNDVTYTTSGTYKQDFTTAGGCDSITVMNLTINENSGQTIERSGCYTYTWHGVTYDESGVYTFDYVDANNCASTDTLVLTISTSSYTTTEVTACDNYTWLGTTYTEDGIYTHANTLNGCEGVDTLVLTLNHSDNVFDIQTACDSYTWNDSTYTMSGVYTGTLTNANGCDSVVNLVLTITQPVSNVVTATACDSYTWIDGETYTASTNTPSVTLTAANGCDSIVTLNLTVYKSTSQTLTETACGSYTWNGATYTTSGNYVQNYVTANGCDSTVTLSLTITPAYSTTLNEVACGSYTWNGLTYTTSGNYTTNLTAANGCDSVVTLNLTVNQPKTSTLTATACGSYAWNGNTYTTSGNYTYTTTAANGCDSTVTLALTIHNASTGTMTATACDSYTWMNGVTYTASTNTPTVTLFNQYGCDSVVTLNLTINNSVSSTITESACGSYTWNGTTYTTSGNYTYSGTTANGCDSTVTLSLTITPAVTNTITATACGSYTWNGTTYTTSGTYTETYTAANGCDSIVTLNLTINEQSSSTTAVAACDSYTWNGNTYTTSGTYVTTTTDANGCPSIDTLVLTISNAIYVVDNQTACDSYTWIDGETYTASTNAPSVTLTSASGCDSVVTLNLTVYTSDSTTQTVTACGSYTWIDDVTYTASTNEPTFTLTNVNGCDSVVTLNLTIGQASASDVYETACDVFIWIDGETYTESTDTPTYTYSDANGCDSVVTLHLTINHSIEVFDTITLEQAQLPYDYNGISITAAGDYEFNGYTANGCDSTVYLTVFVNAVQGIDVVDVLNDVNVYPNPTRGRLTISVDNVEKVEVLDIVGRRVATFENTNTFDISNLGEGAYTLRITLPEGVTVCKVVKK